MFICEKCYMNGNNVNWWWEVAPKITSFCECCEVNKTCADIPIIKNMPPPATLTIDQAIAIYHSAFSSGRIAISNEKEEMEKYFRETLNIEI